MLTRKSAREEAFILIFEKSFSDYPENEILQTAVEVKEFEINDYVKSVFSGVYANIEKIDSLIAECAVGWSINRIGRVALCVMRLAVFEMLFVDEIPVNVSANEAVELCKKYATVEDSSFVNGILGTIIKKINGEQ